MLSAVPGEIPLTDVKRSVASDAWYQLASAKGVVLLHELRRALGAEVFDQALDDFGMAPGAQLCVALCAQVTHGLALRRLCRN